MKKRTIIGIVALTFLILFIFIPIAYLNRAEIAEDLTSFVGVSSTKGAELPAAEDFSITPLFSVGRPDGGGEAEDLTLENETILLLEHAVPGTSVHISVFSWDRPTIVAAIGEAVTRGVIVDVIRSADSRGEAKNVYTDLTSAVGADHLTVCEAGCLGEHINHNKFMLVEELDNGAKNVVVQSSGNFTGSTLIRDNNMLVYGNAPSVYSTYLSYWNDMKAGVKNPDYNRTVDTGNGVIVHFFPQAKGDETLNVLNRVRCVPGARVLIAQAQFSGQRTAVAKKLAQLKTDGCDVATIIDMSQLGERDEDGEREDIFQEGPASYKPVAQILQAANVPIYTTKHVHSKYFLIDAPYGDSTSNKKIVVTGSANLTIGSLRKNDETINIVTNDAVYDAFYANWQDIKSNRSVLLAAP